MFKSYLKLALRNIWKRKTSTVINVLGLSIGLASCILVALFFLHELQFDKGFDNGNDIYRVTSSFDDGSGGPTVAMPFAKYLKSDIPEIEDVSRLDTKCQCIVNVNNAANSTPFMVNNGYWVDADFFKIFSFHFLYGDRNTALNAPNTIVLSQSLAQKFFGNSIPLGKTLKTAGSTYTVSGVFKEDILNHLKPDFFASNNSAGIRESDALNTSWVINPNYYTYIKLRKGSDVTKVEAELKKYTIAHATADMKSSGIHMTNGLQSMAAIHLHSSQWPDYISVMQVNLNYMYLLGSIALAILILGCINYMNLSSAQAIDRAREVGVRRVMGASKYAIRIQFIIETLIISLTSMLMAIGLALLFLHEFNIITNQDLNFFGPGFGELMVCVLLIALMTGLLAGIYPALYLSSFRPVKVLKGKISDGKSVFSARKVLVSVQFIISTFLIFATLIIWQQFDLLRNTKPGFDQDQQLVISEVTPASQANSSIFISQLSANPVFKSVTGATGPLFSGDMNFYAQDKTVADKHDVYLNYTDVNYLPTLNLKLVSGTNFNPEPFANKNTMLDMEAADMARQVILNEQAVQILGLNAYNAPGHYVMHRHNGAIYTYRIMGVVKDFHYQSAHNAIGPYGMVLTNPIRYTTVVAKIQGKNMSEAIKFATQKWKELNPDAPFNYDFMDKTFSYDYDQDQRQQTMLMFYTAVAIFISAIGLLGLITYTLGQKAREIGIRKVIGASVANIVMLFYKQYFVLILIANAIALPLAWYYMSNWLNGFPYRIHISWWMFLAAIASGVVIAFCTIAFRIVKAALANPVESLRAE